MKVTQEGPAAVKPERPAGLAGTARAGCLFRFRRMLEDEHQDGSLQPVPGAWVPGCRQGCRQGSSQGVQEGAKTAVIRQATEVELARGILQAAEATSRPVAAYASSEASGLVVCFNRGFLQGVSCQVEVKGRIVRCRLRSAGAVAREYLSGCRKVVERLLGSSGLRLSAYEVLR